MKDVMVNVFTETDTIMPILNFLNSAPDKYPPYLMIIRLKANTVSNKNI